MPYGKPFVTPAPFFHKLNKIVKTETISEFLRLVMCVVRKQPHESTKILCVFTHGRHPLWTSPSPHEAFLFYLIFLSIFVTNKQVDSRNIAFLLFRQSVYKVFYYINYFKETPQCFLNKLIYFIIKVLSCDTSFLHTDKEP